MSTAPLPVAGPRVVRAPRGPERSCKDWIQEAALRRLLNNLDPEAAEDPDHLVVYGGSGRAAPGKRPRAGTVGPVGEASRPVAFGASSLVLAAGIASARIEEGKRPVGTRSGGAVVRPAAVCLDDAKTGMDREALCQSRAWLTPT
jgi:hypothetical protein